MSYNIAICTPPVSADDSVAWDQLDQFLDAKGPVPPDLKSLYGQLTARYPCICSLSDDEVDTIGVWSDGPLWNNFGSRAANLGVIYSRVEEVYPFLVETALGLGLTIFDWAGPTIYRPS